MILKPWPHNALRHSFGTYALAAKPDAQALALEMGNTPKVLLSCYARRVTSGVAEPYWNLTPDAVLQEATTGEAGTEVRHNAAA